MRVLARVLQSEARPGNTFACREIDSIHAVSRAFAKILAKAFTDVSQDLRNVKLGAFDFSKPKDAALFFLLIRVREYLLREGQSPDHLARAFVHEGFIKGDRALFLPPWKDVFADGLLYSNSSAKVLPLQRADFAAYALNRQQILLGKSKLSQLDQTLLGIFATGSLKFQNIPTVNVKIDEEGGSDLGPQQ